jgi:hypothetical protein
LNAKLQKSARTAEERERRARKITAVVPAF